MITFSWYILASSCSESQRVAKTFDIYMDVFFLLWSYCTFSNMLIILIVFQMIQYFSHGKLGMRTHPASSGLHVSFLLSHRRISRIFCLQACWQHVRSFAPEENHWAVLSPPQGLHWWVTVEKAPACASQLFALIWIQPTLMSGRRELNSTTHLTRWKHRKRTNQCRKI